MRWFCFLKYRLVPLKVYQIVILISLYMYMFTSFKSQSVVIRAQHFPGDSQVKFEFLPKRHLSTIVQRRAPWWFYTRPSPGWRYWELFYILKQVHFFFGTPLLKIMYKTLPKQTLIAELWFKSYIRLLSHLCQVCHSSEMFTKVFRYMKIQTIFILQRQCLKFDILTF